MLKRKIEERLITYYKNKNENILILTGARQIGKTFIIRETAKKYFKNFIEINLESDKEKNKYFENANSLESFYMQLSAHYGKQLGNFDDTIIFLDEIQTYPKLISLLKALKTDGKYRFIASGSLLGLTLKQIFIPIGYILEVKMYPLDFEEYLWARGVGDLVIDYLKKSFMDKTSIDPSLHKSLLNFFKEYLITGGLPSSINIFLEQSNLALIRENQKFIYRMYKQDARKYDKEHSLKIMRIYDLLPSYMENKVKRVKFNQIKEETKGSLEKYQDEFDYLISSGIVNGTKAVSNPKFPLIESASKNLIKLYFNDVGILTSILYGANINPILNENNNINLGSVYETFVAMQLVSHEHELYYFDSKKVGEVDFLINNYDALSILPIEVKSGKNFNNYRAIPKLVDKNGNYKMAYGYILTNSNEIKTQENLITMPIYLAMFI